MTNSNSSEKKCPVTMTSSNGAPMPKEGITSSMSAGEKGPLLLQDFNLIDHLAHFDRERIPERVVHAKGAAAFGYFEVTNTQITKYCKAKLFEQVGKRTPIAIRFSTVGGEAGSADTVRDPRGFAIKFYTEEGNWDLVGNNTPIFFIRDPILFPSFIHTQKRNPQTHLKDPNMVWDFISLRPETVHQISFLFSDRGIPDGYRHMNGYGSHTFKNVNSKGEAVYVKYHFKTDQGIRNLPVEEANRLAGSNPDYSIQDLYENIQKKNYPSWTMYIQVMTYNQANQCSFNPFDVTKIWSHKDYPLLEVGRIVLNQNQENYFAQVEQLAFSPSHMVPGVEPSPDKMLQGRLFSYPDTHRHRLGVNYQQIPVNCPFAPVKTYQRDGSMTVGGNMGNSVNYFPNSFNGPQEAPLSYYSTEAPKVSQEFAKFSTKDDDNFTQCGEFYRKILSEPEKTRLVNNIAESLSGAKECIQKRAIANFSACDVNYGRRILERIAELNKMKKSEATEKPSACPLNPPRPSFKKLDPEALQSHL